MTINSVDSFGAGLAGGGAAVMLVRLIAVAGGNRYTAKAVEFAADGARQLASEELLEVTNLAEPDDTAGQVPPNTDAVAVDVEGRWVTSVRLGGSSSMFAAKVTAAQGGAAYSAREQVMDELGVLTDKAGAADVTAVNLAELSQGPGGAVDIDTIVLVTTMAADGATRYVFHHSTYAKYLT